LAYATGSTGLAITVRGSSRRIMIMRFRPANIRLINRRSNLPRLLLALSSGKSKNNENDKKQPHRLRRVDSVTPYQGKSLIEPGNECGLLPQSAFIGLFFRFPIPMNSAIPRWNTRELFGVLLG